MKSDVLSQIAARKHGINTLAGQQIISAAHGAEFTSESSKGSAIVHFKLPFAGIISPVIHKHCWHCKWEAEPPARRNVNL